MTDDDHSTHAGMAEQLRAVIGRVREDIAARSDPLLEEVATALELLLDLTTHAHDHALDNRARLERLEQA